MSRRQKVQCSSAFRTPGSAESDSFRQRGEHPGAGVDGVAGNGVIAGIRRYSLWRQDFGQLIPYQLGVAPCSCTCCGLSDALSKTSNVSLVVTVLCGWKLIRKLLDWRAFSTEEHVVLTTTKSGPMVVLLIVSFFPL